MPISGPPASLGYPWEPYAQTGGVMFGPRGKKFIGTKNDGSLLDTVGFVSDWFSATAIEAALWNSDGSFTFRILNGIHNVRAYGAVGDGITDDTAAILAMITAAGSNSAVFFPPGIYLKTGVHISLSGITNMLIFGVGDSSIIYNPNNNNRVFWAENSSGIKFKNLHFRGNLVGQTGGTLANGGAVWTDQAVPGATTTVGFVVEDCLFENMNGDSVRIGPGTSRAIVRNNIMNGGLGFVEIRGTAAGPTSDIQVVNNHITATLAAPLRDPTPGTNITGSDDLIDVFGTVDNVLIANNTFDGSSTSADDTTFRAGILIFPLVGEDIKNVTISGNTFRRFTTDKSYIGYRGPIEIAMASHVDGVENINIVGNTILDSDNGIYILNGAGNRGISIVGNSVSNSLVPIYFDADNGVIVGNQTFNSTWGIYHSGVATVIVGNFVDFLVASTSSGIQAGSNDLVTGNRVVGGAATSKSIHVVGDDTVVRGNVVQDALGSALVTHASSNRTKIDGNTLINCASDFTDSGVGTSFFMGTAPAISLTTSTVVADTGVKPYSRITVTPANSVAAALTSVYISTLVSGTSFTINHSSHSDPVNGNFFYQIKNI